MGRKESVFLWSCFVVLWFAFYTLCLFLFLTMGTKSDNSNTYRYGSPQNISREGASHSTRPWKTKTSNLRMLLNSNPGFRDQLLKRTRTHMMKRQNISTSDQFGFNVTISDQLPVIRHLPDTRPNGCRRTGFDLSTLPSVSIVSAMFNEPLSSLLRHVHSLLVRTPKELLHEIIIVDDNSMYAFLDNHLDDYFKVLDPRIKVLRNEQREGLVRTRMNGAQSSSGEVIVFLDSHMEVNVGWLEPLLYELVLRGKNTIVQPDVVTISPHTLDFSEKTDASFRGGFGWDLRYSWLYKPDYLYPTVASMADPFPTPVLVGCAIAVWRGHFLSTGGFDSGLNIWGGEHFELSFKTWMTGGHIYTVPCSKVGHIFKYGKFLFGPGFPDILRKNLARVAEVWMDEYKEIFFASQRYGADIPVFSSSEIASMEERRNLRRRLKSKSFQWFMKVVIPEMRIPSSDAVHYGEIENHSNGLCITVNSSGYLTLTTMCFKHRILPENQFTIDRYGRFLHDGKCVSPDKRTLILTETLCDRHTSHEGLWSLSPGPLGGYIKFKTNLYGFMCVVAKEADENVFLALEKCVENRKDAFWWFQYKLQFV